MNKSQLPPSVVVSNTAPILSAWYGEFLHLFPKLLKNIHIQQSEKEEWTKTIPRIIAKLTNPPEGDINKLLAEWEDSFFVRIHPKQPRLEATAQRFSKRIHPKDPSKAVDGEVLALAQLLYQTEAIDALLADEEPMRKIAMDEGLPVIGSLGIARELCRARIISREEAEKIPDKIEAHGQHIGIRLKAHYLQQIESLPT